jgi:hypothetical protein
MSRFGKIGRLPLDIREQLNRRLQDGEIGKDLVVWLNSVPEVQAVLKAEFGERPVNEPNLSDWRTGGYEDWLVQQETMQQVNQLVANAKELTGASQTPLSELLATCLAARYAVELSRLTATRTPREGTRPTAEAEGDKGCDLEGRNSRLKAAFAEREAEGDGGCDLEVLRKICRAVLALRRLDLAAQRLRIEREAADRELRADEKQQKKEWLAAANAAVERENRRINGLVWRLDHQDDPAYAHCCVPLSPAEEAELFDGEEPEEEHSAGEPEAAGAAVEGQPVAAQEQPIGGSQSSPLREKGPKEGAKGAGKTGVAVAAGTTGPDGSGQSNKGELSKIKAEHEQPVGGSQSSPLREESPKEDANGAGKTAIAVTPEAAAQGPSGLSNKGELSKIKATKGKLRMPKTGAASKAVAKAVRDAKILAGTLKVGE